VQVLVAIVLDWHDCDKIGLPPAQPEGDEPTTVLVRILFTQDDQAEYVQLVQVLELVISKAGRYRVLLGSPVVGSVSIIEQFVYEPSGSVFKVIVEDPDGIEVVFEEQAPLNLIFPLTLESIIKLGVVLVLGVGMLFINLIKGSIAVVPL
jgi:hypothetical protein